MPPGDDQEPSHGKRLHGDGAAESDAVAERVVATRRVVGKGFDDHAARPLGGALCCRENRQGMILLK